MNEKELNELNIFCAERVMGWTIQKNPMMRANDGKTYFDPSNSMKMKWEDDYGSQEYLWTPTTDPAAAFEVLKKCGQKYVGAIQIVMYETAPICLVQCNHDQISAEAETLELAICLFAKKFFTKPL